MERGFRFGDERGIIGTGVVIAEPDEVKRVIGIFTRRIAIDDSLILNGGFGEAFLCTQQVGEFNLCQRTVVGIRQFTKDTVVVVNRPLFVALFDITVGDEEERAFVILARFRNRGVPNAGLFPVTEHFVRECLVHDTRFHLRNTLGEIVVTLFGDTGEECFIVEHRDGILIGGYRFLQIVRVECRVRVAFLITFGFGGFVVGAALKEFAHQFDEVELW